MEVQIKQDASALQQIETDTSATNDAMDVEEDPKAPVKLRDMPPPKAPLLRRSSSVLTKMVQQEKQQIAQLVRTTSN